MTEEQRRESLPWRRRLAILLLLVVAASVIWRVRIKKEERGEAVTPRAATQLVPGTTGGEEEPPPTAKEKILGYLTEAAIAMLLGMMLGIATTVAIKTVVVLLVVGVAGAQFYAYKTGTAIDWGAAGNWVKEFVFNLTGGADLKQVAVDKLPSLGAFVIGYFLGLKRK